MSAIKEGFELLNHKGVDRNVQHLFFDVLKEETPIKLSADYKERNDKVVDQEIITISKIRFASEGILHFSEEPPTLSRTLFISDSLINLVFFAKLYGKRLSFNYSTLVACGARLDKKLFMAALGHYPNVQKCYVLFGHSLTGRIKDCKVQHWIKGQDCHFRLDINEVISFFRGNEFRMPVGEFSLRKHLKQVGTRQTITTYKPMNKNIDNYYRFNYF